MKVGVIYPQIELGGDPTAIGAIGRATEAAGYDHLLAYDHVLGASHDREPKLAGPYTENDPFHDPLTMFAYLAGVTERIELVTGVLILPQRQTVLVARQAADVDLLSGQRLRLGVGIGWNYVEYEALGQDFGTRGKRFDEQIDLLRKLWLEPILSFDGRFDRIDRAALNPRPRRDIPLWIGGSAEVALRRAARVADGFVFAEFGGEADSQLATLRRFLAEEGREPGTFGLHLNPLGAKDAPAVIDRFRQWRDQGGTHASVTSMRLGLRGADEHIAYIERTADALRAAGLL